MALLAKPDETILEHTENVLKVFRSIRESYPNIPDICGVRDFWEHLFYAIFFHDFGKGAEGFQKIFNSNEKWNYRHEILSAGFVSSIDYPENESKKGIALAIITHHKDITELESYSTFSPPGTISPGQTRYFKNIYELKVNFEKLAELFDYISIFSEKYLGYEINNFKRMDSTDSLIDVYREFVVKYRNAWDDDEYTPLHGKYGIFLKGFITACDHLASGGKYEILNGISDMKAIYQFPKLRKTQEIALKTKGNAFLIAPTGSGKTEAALFWTHANQNERKSRRVFYLLPYTASINAMYKRLQKDFNYLFSWSKVPGSDSSRLLEYLKVYFGADMVTNTDITKTDDKKTIIVSPGKNSIEIAINKTRDTATIKYKCMTHNLLVEKEDGELNIYDSKNTELVGIQHGKAAYYLYKIFSEDEEYITAKDKAREIKDLTKKIYRPYKILTPFQVLKAVFGMKGFEQQLSEMTNGLFILDEIHSYDAHTTSLIIETLKILKEEYNANLLIMSATLPTFLKEIFQQKLNIQKENDISLDEHELKKFTRHRVTILPKGIFDNLDKIKNAIREKKKVLVVCNTVYQAQNVYRELSKEVKNSRLIHGRFILRDREAIEKDLEHLDLLVGTQAIEVSLNIDYDVLFSEPAPIDALIQRFGRVNRKGWETKRICPVYIFEEGSEKDKFVYKNQKFVKKTIKLLKKEDVLEEDTVQRLVDEVYASGYQGKDKEEFEEVSRIFPKFFKKIVPFIHDNRSKEDFYKLFDSVEVVPLKYKLDYLEELNDKRYFEAMKYITSISFGQYFKLKNNNQIECEKNAKFVSVDYDEKLGLLLDEESHTLNIL